MMVKRYRVRLAEDEQQGLMSLVSKGRGAAAYKQTHARILLLCDENQADGPMKDEDIARALKVGTATLERVYRLYSQEGLMLRIKKPKRHASCQRRKDRPVAAGMDERWSMDFMSDELFDGRRIRLLTMSG